MKISYNWLKYHFGELPNPKELEEKITFGVFEVESVEEINDDTIIDLKVLPDRAHYALSFNGIGYEVGALIGKPFEAKKFLPIKGAGNKVAVEVQNAELCPRYMARYVGSVKVTGSSGWLKQELEKIGQRSINSLVDMANFVMFTTGQPMHIFDADKIAGTAGGKTIIVRPAKTGEKIDCLDGNTYKLGPDNLLIADAGGPLVVAGVKGGRRAEVTMDTKNIIIESANFDPVSVRKTSAKLKLKSDAAKRYENAPTPAICVETMDMLCRLIQRENKSASFGEITDVYPSPVKPWTVEFSKEYVESRLGRKISDKDVENVLKRIQCEIVEPASRQSPVASRYSVQPPLFRLDLQIEEDMVEEIGRLLGYDKIKEILPPKISKDPTVATEFYLSEKVKDLLVAREFSEAILYTLGQKGDYETLYPVAKDRAFLRKSLLPHLEESLAMNTRNADLLELDEVKEFEVGKAFDKNGEHLMVGIVVGFAKKIKGKKPGDIVKSAFADIERELGLKLTVKYEEKDLLAFGEALLDEALSKTKVKDPYKEIAFKSASGNMYVVFSKFPFAVRDVAVFVPNSIGEGEVKNLIKESAGDLCVKLRLFDVFRKGDKTSYAYRLVLQAMDRTLTEGEINGLLNDVYNALKGKKWEIR